MADSAVRSRTNTKKDQVPSSCLRSSRGRRRPAPISILTKQWIGSPCSSTCGVLISFALYSKGVLAHQSIRRYDGWNRTDKNFLKRRNLLRKIIRADTSVQVSSFIAGHRIELFRLAKEKGLEGIMAKRAVPAPTRQDCSSPE
jgi:hypothetical protein